MVSSRGWCRLRPPEVIVRNRALMQNDSPADPNLLIVGQTDTEPRPRGESAKGRGGSRKITFDYRIFDTARS